jgi:hypothetical protein
MGEIMAFKKFADFLSEQQKGSLPGKSEPALGKGHKLPKQYYAKGAEKDRGLVTADDDRGMPLGEKGMPGMTPKTVQPYGQKPAGSPKKLKSSKGKMPKHMKTEAFLEATNNLSDAQFTANLLENQNIPKPKLHSLDGRKFTPEPAETMRYVVALALQNEAMMSRLIREMKRNGGLSNLVNELLNHGEVFNVLAEAASVSNRISRKLNEAVAGPQGMGGGGGSPAGPNGASAGGVPHVNAGGGGMGGATPPSPPSEGEETPEGGAGNLLDDGEEEGEEDDNLEDDDKDDDDDNDDDDDDDDDDDGDHDDGETHIHIHHHHHGDDKKKKKLDLGKSGGDLGNGGGGGGGGNDMGGGDMGGDFKL